MDEKLKQKFISGLLGAKWEEKREVLKKVIDTLTREETRALVNICTKRKRFLKRQKFKGKDSSTKEPEVRADNLKVPDKPLQKDSGEKRKFEEIRIEIDSGATSMPNDKFQEKRFAEGGLEIQSEQTSATLNNAKGLIIGECESPKRNCSEGLPLQIVKQHARLTSNTGIKIPRLKSPPRPHAMLQRRSPNRNRQEKSTGATKSGDRSPSKGSREGDVDALSRDINNVDGRAGS